MSHKTLALKWRPKKFQEIIGQPHITRSFQNSIANNRINSAYLFTGTRGIGKTSLARIFSKALCCLNPLEDKNPCCICEHCIGIDQDRFLDVIEIDGASNNSVENVRQLIENVKYVPTKGKYKIYIIDEVHMLSINAFNALLKTLEEPPEHVIFIMATTDIDKLPDTVVSRCQRFDFRLIPLELLVTHVNYITSAENRSFENSLQIEQICNHGRGSARDTLSTLEQVFSFSSDPLITKEDVTSILGLANATTVGKLVEGIIIGNQKNCSSIYRELIRENIEVSSIVKSVLDHLFQIIEHFDNEETLSRLNLLSNNLKKEISIEEIFWIYETLAKDASWILTSIDPTKITEITIQKIALRRTLLGSSSLGKSGEADNTSELRNPIAEQSATPKKEAEITSQELDIVVDLELTTETETETETEIIAETTTPGQLPSWDSFLTHLRTKTITMASNLEQGNLTKSAEDINGTLQISLGFHSSALVFLEYLQDSTILERLKNEVALFYKYSVDNTNITLVDVDNEQKEEINFQSKVEIYQENENIMRKQKEEEFANLEEVTSAEKLFNTKIDKIIVNITDK